MDLFGGIFKGKRILITGDSGFKGSWMAIWLKELGAEVFGYSLPAKTLDDNFVRTRLSEKINHLNADIRDLDALKTYFKEVNPDIAFHLAAQALVLQSYDDPVETFHSNILGTVHFLECIRSTPSIQVAVNVSSDKCYDNKEWIWGYRENDPMGGKDPYSASKGAAELVFASYLNSFFSQDGTAAIASGRAGNVVGGGDWAENRIVPDAFRAFRTGEALQLRNPDATRPWQHVLEPVFGYMALAQKLWENGKQFSGGWNFGPMASNNFSVYQLLVQIQRQIPMLKVQVPVVDNKPHEAHLLKLDISKALGHLPWRPLLNWEKTIEFTVQGYLDEIQNPGDIYDFRVRQIQNYASNY
jgi:CDP-glucose 4,6-dehydratase